MAQPSGTGREVWPGADQSACGWGQLLQLARVPVVVGRPHPVLKEVAVLVRDDLQPAMPGFDQRCFATTTGSILVLG